ncbi:glycosyltransferase [Skermania sp. ID1734]|uniref:glycosyltransferase n=1 Tax=Skermania sp. ID1734 TaxID=2597516 RepID=UPI00163DC524|nr:glycosyltransferase [Skermania sp. ID1734]
MKVCIATYDIIGPVRNGGIGTANSELARSLVAAGHHVTVLYLLGTYCEDGTISEWVADYRRRGITLVPLPPSKVQLGGPYSAVVSMRAYEWLRASDFDVVHFHDWRGAGFFSVYGRRSGHSLANTRIVVTAHSPILWHKYNNYELLTDPEDIRTDYLERESVRLADELVSPSNYMIDWMRHQGWRLPERVTVRQNVFHNRTREARPLSISGTLQVDEIVFFGRLEVRKGLRLFCDAIDRAEISRPVKVTFLGKTSTVDGAPSTSYIAARASRWNLEYQVITNKDQSAALDYLAEPGRLAVIASLAENSPYTVLECLASGIPFLASAVGGIPELIAPDSHLASLFEPTANSLAIKLAQVLGQGAQLAKFAVHPSEVEQETLIAHESRNTSIVWPDFPEDDPFVSVCLIHFERPRYLDYALKSLSEQDYTNFEVILVDDGSSSEDAVKYLATVTTRYPQLQLKVIRQDNKYLGAARNAAASEASGDWLLFMDDDNAAKPYEISTFIRVAQRTGADIVVCQLDVFRGDEAEHYPPTCDHRALMTGGPVSLGAIRNCFGDANSLVRRKTFDAVGGFTEDYGLGHEDWEFFSTAALQGAVTWIIPDALFWYRQSNLGMLKSTEETANLQRNIRPYLSAVPPSLQPLVLLAQGQGLKGSILDESFLQVSLAYRIAKRFDRFPRTKRLLKRFGNKLVN